MMYQNKYFLSQTFITNCKDDLIKQLNYGQDEKRLTQLKQQLERLHEQGFYVELLPSIEPKFFVEKQGFSIKEALIITRGKDQARPKNEDIQRLQFDDETNILKLEFENMPFENNQKKTYFVILGPPNRGKTTFVFNLINKIFNVQYNSMFRVKKKQIKKKEEYYDEYYIQISGKNYVFVDFRGIGDLKLDFLGLDESGNSNVYITILEYLQQEISIAAVFYVNSSSINRLSEDESYCLQRFFELIPNRIIQQHKLFLVLTYCTDNQPKMTIYEQSDSTPQDLKNLLKNKAISDEEKFWYGINNKPLYEPVIFEQQIIPESEKQKNLEKYEKLIEQQKKEKLKNDQIDILIRNLGKEGKDGNLEPEKEVNNGLQLGRDENNENDERGDVEIAETQLGKFQYNLMTNIISEIIKKIQILNNSNDNNSMNKQYFENKLSFEKNIIELLKVYKLGTQGLKIEELKIKEFQTTYLAYELKDLNEKETYKIKKGSKLLLCQQCRIQCHINCCFNDISEMQGSNMCRMFEKYNDGKKESYECKKCKKKGISKVSCQPQNHILVEKAGEMTKKTLVTMIIQDNYKQIMENMPQNKKSKALYRLQQTAALKGKLKYQNQIVVIKNLIHQNSQENCIPIDLNQRAKYLNTMMTQLKNNNQTGDEFYKKLEEINEIYQNVIDPQQQQKEQLQKEQLQKEQQQKEQQQKEQQQKEQKEQQQKEQLQQIPELDIKSSNISQSNQNNSISFRQQSNEQQNSYNQQFESIQRVSLKNSAYFNNSNEQQQLIPPHQ